MDYIAAAQLISGHQQAEAERADRAAKFQQQLAENAQAREDNRRRFEMEAEERRATREENADLKRQQLKKEEKIETQALKLEERRAIMDAEDRAEARRISSSDKKDRNRAEVFMSITDLGKEVVKGLATRQ